ncbi:MAG: AmmeMemoRadiSam system protein B, partial [Candidatus Portnoybacteria bacterium]|nr:AmmeMemoRadiSam system protein B [Candidatus Portnoybacteria bacterium]
MFFSYKNFLDFLVIGGCFLLFVYISHTETISFFIKDQIAGSKNNYAGEKLQDIKSEKIAHESLGLRVEINQENRIHGVIVPHHLVASSIIEETFNQVRDYFEINKIQITQIVILSPNHFLNGKKSVIASDWNWQTNFGIVDCDKEFLEKLKLFNFADIESEKLKEEHGVANVVPFVKYYFPEAKVVPLMIRDSF